MISRCRISRFRWYGGAIPGHTGFLVLIEDQVKDILKGEGIGLFMLLFHFLDYCLELLLVVPDSHFFQ